MIQVDGEALNFDFTIDSNIHAIQWNGTTGHVEFKDNTLNEDIADFSAYQPLLDAYNAEKQRISEAEALKISQRTYRDKRVYPTPMEQFDMMYHDSVDGTTLWIEAIEAVKAEFPKT
jgi:hypothetical protein